MLKSPVRMKSDGKVATEDRTELNSSRNVVEGSERAKSGGRYTLKIESFDDPDLMLMAKISNEAND